MFEIGEALEAENEKPELDVLVDVINEHLDYFNEDKDFEKEVEDAVQEIEIPPKHPCPSCNKICKSKGGLTRHIRSKHTLLEANDGKDDNSSATISKEIVEDLFKKANSKIMDNLYGEEIVVICKNLTPSPLCVHVLGKLHRRFSQKSNQDTLVMNYTNTYRQSLKNLSLSSNQLINGGHSSKLKLL